MAVGPAHSYIEEGINKGFNEEPLERVVAESRSLAIKTLPPIYSLKHLSHYTGVQYGYLRDVVKRKSSPYQAYSIPKRSGGSRLLHAPEEYLKTVQRWISRNILHKVDSHWRSYAYHQDASIMACAAEHCQSRWLIKIDVERFFESISEIQVYRLFRELGYKPLVSFELARLTTIQPCHLIEKRPKRWILYQRSNEPESLPYSKKRIKYIGRLPQGAPTSPQLSNLIFRGVDDSLDRLAEEYGMTYTRYADDIALSTRKKNFTRDQAVHIVGKVYKLLLKNGYSPQHRKLKIIPPGAKKVVLGLLVDSSVPRLQKGYIKKIQTHLRGMEKFGIPDHSKHRKFKSAFAMLDHVRGLINYASYIDSSCGMKLMERYKQIIERSGLEP